jgi:hypothetical protein
MTLGWWMILKELVQQLQKSLVSPDETHRLHHILPYKNELPSIYVLSSIKKTKLNIADFLFLALP